MPSKKSSKRRKIQHSAQKPLAPPSNSPTLKQQNRLLFGALVAILVWTAFTLSPTLQNNFTNWDDNFYVLDNPHVQDLSAQNLTAIFTQPIAGNYHPLTILSLAINYQFSGETALGYLLTNLLLHLLNCALVFWFLYSLSGKKWIVAAIVSLIFGIHPLHVESVAWISARKDVLYAFFFLLGLITYWKYLNEQVRKYYIWAVLAFLAALLSKPTAVVFPLVVLWMHYYKKTHKSKIPPLERVRGRFKNSEEKVFPIHVMPLFALSLLWGLLTLYTQSSSGAVTFEHAWWQQPLFACYAFMVYLFKFFLPLQLCAFYPYPLPQQALPIVFYIAPIGVLLVITAVVYSWRKAPIVFLGIEFLCIEQPTHPPIVSRWRSHHCRALHLSALHWIGVDSRTGFDVFLAAHHWRKDQQNVALE